MNPKTSGFNRRIEDSANTLRALRKGMIRLNHLRRAVMGGAGWNVLGI